MNLEFYLAKKLGNSGNSRESAALSAGGKRESKRSRGGIAKSSRIIATVSIAASIAIIIGAVAISSGFNEEIREKTSGFSGDIILTPMGVPIDNHGSYPVQPISYLDDFTAINGVKSVYPVVYSPAVLKTETGMEGVIFKGVGQDYDLSFFEKNLCSGRLPEVSDGAPQVLISRSLANELELDCGDALMSYFVSESGVKVRKFNICGIFDAQLDRVDKSLAITDASTIARVNGWQENECSGYEIFLKSRNYSDQKIDAICNAVDDILQEKSTDDVFSLQMLPLKDSYWVFYDWLNLLDINVLIILVLMIAVAGFNIISGLLIIIFEHISTIGLFKALGMENNSIFKLFIYKSLAMVGRGMLYGNIVAVSFCIIQRSTHFITLDPVNYLIDHVPVHLTLSTFIATNVASAAAILLIMLIPSRIISKIDPAKALQVK